MPMVIFHPQRPEGKSLVQVKKRNFSNSLQHCIAGPEPFSSLRRAFGADWPEERGAQISVTPVSQQYDDCTFIHFFGDMNVTGHSGSAGHVEKNPSFSAIGVFPINDTMLIYECPRSSHCSVYISFILRFSNQSNKCIPPEFFPA